MASMLLGRVTCHVGRAQDIRQVGVRLVRRDQIDADANIERTAAPGEAEIIDGMQQIVRDVPRLFERAAFEQDAALIAASRATVSLSRTFDPSRPPSCRSSSSPAATRRRTRFTWTPTRDRIRRQQSGGGAGCVMMGAWWRMAQARRRSRYVTVRFSSRCR